MSKQLNTEESLLGDAILEENDFVVSQQPDYAAAQAPLQFQNYCLFSLHTIKASTKHTTGRETGSPGKRMAALEVLEVSMAQPLYLSVCVHISVLHRNPGEF